MKPVSAPLLVRSDPGGRPSAPAFSLADALFCAVVYFTLGAALALLAMGWMES